MVTSELRLATRMKWQTERVMRNALAGGLLPSLLIRLVADQTDSQPALYICT